MNARWKMIYKGQLKDFDPLSSLEYWRDKTAEEKFFAVSALIKQALAIKGKTFDGRKFLRTTAVIKRT
jgi:hypothetical protein